jgi:hypothetical protein
MESRPHPSPLPKSAFAEGAKHSLEELWEGLENADRLGIIFSIPAFGLAAAVIKLLEPGISGKGLQTFWEIFAGTAPLSCSVALTVVAYLREWYSAKGLLAFGAITLFLATWIGAHTGNPILRQNIGNYVELVRLGPIGAGIGYILTTLWQYWHLYGDWKFLCSAASGTYIGWFWGTKILPHFD